MIKRISLLIAAALLVATMAMAGLAAPVFADPNCDEVPNNKNCVVTGPGNSENTSARDKNPNVKNEFKPDKRNR